MTIYTKQLYYALSMGSWVKQQCGYSPALVGSPLQLEWRKAARAHVCYDCGRLIEQGEMHGSAMFEHYCSRCVTDEKPAHDFRRPAKSTVTA